MATKSMDVEQRRLTTFGVVFGILAIFTALEIGTAYLPTLPQGVRVGLLVFLAIVKIALVLLYFMHLRFDNRIFALPFALGVVLAIPIILIVGYTAQAQHTTPEEHAVSNTGQVIDVREISYQIQFSQYSANAGPVTFHIVNGADGMLHEFILFQTDTPASELPTDDAGRVIEDAMTIITSAEDIPPSDSRDVTVNLAAGHYVIVCNLPGHYEQGMRVDFTVNGTSNAAPSTPESTAAPTAAPTKAP